MNTATNDFGIQQSFAIIMNKSFSGLNIVWLEILQGFEVFCLIPEERGEENLSKD